MLARDIRRRFIDFFVKKHGHVEISSAPIIPENDPTVLFTTAGMHPLVPYLMGEKHPAGTRLVDAQKCLRTDDIEEVGDETHCTFFEMLGNWSLGDYFKKEAIEWSYEFLTMPLSEGGLGLDPIRLQVTCFEGDSDAPRDDEAASYWENLGFTRVDKTQNDTRKLIYFYEKKKNWWGPAGQTGPCGPDTEMFYDRCPELSIGEHKPGASRAAIERYVLKDGSLRCHPNCECGRYVEIWNDVFMQYNKQPDGSFIPLKQQNVDTGMGLERVTSILQEKSSYFETELFSGVIGRIRALATQQNVVSERIIADHVRAATFVLGDKRGVTPCNTDQGYVLRRLIRRAIRHARMLGIENQHFLGEFAGIFVDIYGDVYPELTENCGRIMHELSLEEDRFIRTLKKGLQEFEELMEKNKDVKEISGYDAFYLYETYGFPLEEIQELARARGIDVDTVAFEEAFKNHQDKSRIGAQHKFAGGLADHSWESTRLHTATHLLHEALRRVLGKHVEQRGSNITPERLRFDFSHTDKLTKQQIAQVEDLVNQQIQRDLEVHWREVKVPEARELGAIGLFPDRYDEIVKVYQMGDFSKEICGGPHVEHTGQVGKFRILKEEACSAGVRRIKAVVG